MYCTPPVKYRMSPTVFRLIRLNICCSCVFSSFIMSPVMQVQRNSLAVYWLCFTLIKCGVVEALFWITITTLWSSVVDLPMSNACRERTGNNEMICLTDFYGSYAIFFPSMLFLPSLGKLILWWHNDTKQVPKSRFRYALPFYLISASLT